MKFLYLSIVFLLTQSFFGQNGSISGSVVDDATGNKLPGVNVLIRTLKLSTTADAAGKFVFKNVPAGSYEVEFLHVGYSSKIISEVITKNNEITYLNTTLAEVKNVLKEVVITRTKAKTESVQSLLVAQKNNASVSDGISAETIKRTPDKTTSDVLKRISGASIQDNKFVIIRGLNDRYNVAFLNGAPLPSSEPDRKAFSFDIFPANMLDNLVITKSASPDLPGEFAGGVIQINTKSIPDKNFQTLSVGSGYNSITTFKTQKTYKGSSTDWLGFDNGARALPSTIPSTEVFTNGDYTKEDKAIVAQSFESDWNILNAKFKPNTNFQYSLGHHFDFGEKVLGVIVSLSNNQSRTYAETTRYKWAANQNPNIPSVLNEKFNDKNYTEQVLTAGLANFALKFNDNHSLTFKNIYSINSTDLVVERYGQKDVLDPIVTVADVRWFTSNKIYSGQLNGDHYFAQPKIKINWTGFYSDIKREIPNLRRNVYSIANPDSTNPSETVPVASITTSLTGGNDFAGSMFFSENKEAIHGGKIDLSKKFTLGKDFITEFKLGGFTQKRDRDFFARQLNYAEAYANFDRSLLNLPNATIFSQANMGVRPSQKDGFTLFELTKPSDSYKAGSQLHAGYLMLDNKFKNVRLVWGVRLEDYTQTLNAKKTETDILNQKNKQSDVLPSVNLIYSLSPKQNLRISYSKTLNRPEFRELAPFGFYDFTTQFFTEGNPDLKIATIKNFDFRYEWYPGKGQILSFSYFKKNFTNPIELQQNLNNKSVSYQNAKSAKNSGVELEFRALLSSVFATKDISVLNDLTLFSNVAVIKSEVDVSNIPSANKEKVRPLQGQSPYIFNTGLQYLNADTGWVIALNANRAGNRILYTSKEGEEALWEKGRTFLDLQFAKSFLKNKLELKLNIQNILAQDLIFYQNVYKDDKVKFGGMESVANSIFVGDRYNVQGYDSSTDDLVWKTNLGRTFSLTATYNF